MAGNNKAILLILGAVEKKNAPMTVKELMDVAQLSQDGCYKACKRAIEAGYLSKTIETVMHGKQPHQTSFYARTDKAYVDHRAKTAAERKMKWREKNNQKKREERAERGRQAMEKKKGHPNLVPFRDPLVAIWYGPRQFSGQVSTVERRVIDRFVEIVAEEVEA